jgi:hypothetical protein
MNKKTLIILGGSLVLLGVGGYFAYKWWVNRDLTSNKGSEAPPTITTDAQDSDFWKSGDLVNLTKDLTLTRYVANQSGKGFMITPSKDNLTTKTTFAVIGNDTFADGKRYVVIAPKGSNNTYYAISVSALKKA